MSFFKEFKDDFSQAVDELMSGTEGLEENNGSLDKSDDMVVNTLDEETDAQSELSKLGGLLEPVEEEMKENDEPAGLDVRQIAELEREFSGEIQKADERTTVMEEEKQMNEEMMTVNDRQMVEAEEAVSDEVTIITESTSINGDINANGSVDICGRIAGNVTCRGKLTVTGVLEGNSHSSEFFADAAKIQGEVHSSGTVKIGIGSVVIGNITANSAVIAGAIKGDVDVQGPVVVDTSAVVMGNIKSRSVQINNGAVIEGFCSQCYADIDVQSLFEDKKGN